MSLRALRSILLAAGLIVTLAISEGPALGHGDHGGAESLDLAGSNLVVVGPYEIEFLARPVPLVAARENRVIARVLDNSTGSAVRGASVFMRVTAAPGPDQMAADQRTVGLDQFSPAPEEVWAGNYTLVTSFPKKGRYRAQVVIMDQGVPLRAEFRFSVSRPPGLSPSLIFVMAVALSVAGGGLYIMALKGRPWIERGQPFNLLDIPWVKKFIVSRWFEPAFQVPAIIMMAVVLYLGIMDAQEGSRSLATRLTWTIWWAGIIFTFVLVGRLWCLVCPFGALNEWPGRLLKVRRRLPVFMRNIWIATFFFVLLTLADEQLGVVRSPMVTAWIIIFFAGVAILVGLFYERRSFCRYLCPIGGIIGLYSMVSPVELRVKDLAVCKGHRIKDCFFGNERGCGCPMFEFPQVMSRNTYCNLCGECIKTCPLDNLTIRVRPLGQDIWAGRRVQMDEAYLAAALVGITSFVTAVMLKSWLGWMIELGKLIPVNLIRFMKPVTMLALMESSLFLIGALVAVPLIIWGAAAIGDRMAGRGRRKGTRLAFILFAYIFIPIGLAMHLSHNVAHLLLEGPGIVPALQRAVERYTPFSIGSPNWAIEPLTQFAVVYWIQMGLILFFYGFSVFLGYRLAVRTYGDPETGFRAALPMLILSLAFTIANLYLLNQPMGPRHG